MMKQSNYHHKFPIYLAPIFCNKHLFESVKLLSNSITLYNMSCFLEEKTTTTFTTVFFVAKEKLQEAQMCPYIVCPVS